MISPFEATLFLMLLSVVGVVIFRYLNLPPMLGYLTVGIIAGPYVFAIIPNIEQAQNLAEFGVVFLMFSIGLEFSLKKLRAMRRLVFGLGTTQVVSTILLTIVFGKLFNISWQASVALGGAFAMSSTAIVSKMLVEQLEVETSHGRKIFGILIFQDLAVVPLLIIITALGGNASSGVGYDIFVALLKILVVFSLMFIVGKQFMARWLRVIVRLRNQEIFMLNLLLLTLGGAFITQLFGLSLALGAFIVGMLISETRYRHQVEEDIKPFRDILLGLFFITTGMLLDPRVIIEHPWIVLLFLFLQIVVKGLLIFGLTRLFHASPGVAMRTGLCLAQAGEFSFVLVGLTMNLQLADQGLLQAVLAAMLISMMIAPFLIQNSERIVLRFISSEWLARSLQMTKVASQSLQQKEHVIICGYGRTGQNLGKMLKQEGVDYVALDLDPDRMGAVDAVENPVVFGDAARRESLLAAGVKRAAAVVVTYKDTRSTVRVLDHMHELAPTIPVVVRTADDSSLDELMQAGATAVISDSLEGSLMLVSHTLVLLGMPMRQALQNVEKVRDARYDLLRGYFSDEEDDIDEDQEYVRLQSVLIQVNSQAIGHTLQSLQLDDLSVDVIAIRRAGIRGSDPDPQMVIRSADVLVLRGLPDDLLQAEKILTMTNEQT